MRRVVVFIAVLALGIAGGWVARGVYYGDAVIWEEVSGDLLAEVEAAAADEVEGEVSSVSCKELVRPADAYDCLVRDPDTEGIGYTETVRVTTDGERVVSAKNLGFVP